MAGRPMARLRAALASGDRPASGGRVISSPEAVRAQVAKLGLDPIAKMVELVNSEEVGENSKLRALEMLAGFMMPKVKPKDGEVEGGARFVILGELEDVDGANWEARNRHWQEWLLRREGAEVGSEVVTLSAETPVASSDVAVSGVGSSEEVEAPIVPRLGRDEGKREDRGVWKGRSRESKSRRNEALLADVRSGMKLTEVSAKYGITTARVNQIRRGVREPLTDVEMERLEEHRRRSGCQIGIRSAAKAQRNAALLTDLRLGMKVTEVALKYGIGVHRVYQIRKWSARLLS